MSEWTHRYVKSRKLPESAGWGKRRTITVTAGLHKLDGNARPYFSVTAEIVNGYNTRGDDPTEACGAMHDEILRWFPKLAPVVALHLSDDTGAPMYDVENGAYWLGLTKWQAFSAAYVARHFRITEDEAQTLVGLTRSDVEAWVETQRPRWQREADEACALLDTLAGA
jgi:hypothetical protein